MKKNYLILMIAIMFILVFINCSNTTKKTGGDNSDSTSINKESENGSLDGKKRYEFKSGIITMKSTVMGMTQTMIRYFTEYGEKESIEMQYEMTGMKFHTLSITQDGYYYNINLVNNEGTKMKIPDEDAMNINFNDTEKLSKELNLKKEGTEEFLGKTCDKYTMNYEKMKMKGTYWVWKGISMKTEIETAGMKTVMEATKIEVDVDIPSEKVEIPTNIKFKEIQPQGNDK